MRYLEAVSVLFDSIKWNGPAGLSNAVNSYVNIMSEPSNVSSSPLIAQIEPTLYCNLKCKMCSNPLSKRTRRHMKLEEFKKIMDRMPFLRKISLVGAGEPLMNPELFGMIAYARSKGVRVGFATNGMLLDNDMCRRIIDSKVDWVNISLDSDDKAQYEMIRPGASFDKVISGIRSLARMKGSGRNPDLSVWFVIMEENFSRLPKVIELVKELGVDKVSAQQQHSWSNDALKDTFGRGAEEGGLNEIRDILKKSAAKAMEIGVTFDFVNVPDPLSCRACKWPWKSCYITVEGMITPCCLQGSDPGIINFGNIMESGFSKIWNGEEYKKFREALRSDKRPSICVDCTAYPARLKI